MVASVGVFLGVVSMAAWSPEATMRAGRGFLSPEGCVMLACFVFAVSLAWYLSGFGAMNKLMDASPFLSVVLVILFIPALILAALSGVRHFTDPVRKQCEKQVAAMVANMTPLVGRLKSSTFANPQSREVAEVPRKPFLLLATRLDGSVPVLSKAGLHDGWLSHGLGDIGSRMYFEIVHPIPDFEPKSFVIVAYDFKPTGRTIQLDDGAVPEWRHYAQIFVIDVDTLKVVWNSSLLAGSEASKPFRSPGIHYYSSLGGDKVPWGEIRRAIDSIPWAGSPPIPR